MNAPRISTMAEKQETVIRGKKFRMHVTNPADTPTVLYFEDDHAKLELRIDRKNRRVTVETFETFNDFAVLQIKSTRSVIHRDR